MCLDYRPLNSVCQKDNYQMQNVDDILDKLAGAKYFSILDAISGYYKIALDPESQKKTAFTWQRKRYEFTRMPFGLINAPASSQKIMGTIFDEHSNNFVIPYLYEIIIFSGIESEHLRHLEFVLNKLQERHIYLNKKKCNFMKQEIKIPGQIIRKSQREVDLEKITIIEKCPIPSNVKELRSFLGFPNYCRSFIQRFANISSHLMNY
ncbi:putative LTR retrotransposon [Pseudoloma neurophilia]|uniref:Putative LTR retrotransposon n=1 Tax=Pseudoloma neurophilia TaxID=146866 RepID=A0A0R0M438_9MICR|nr:putative LTR retrotransposon [Pseudoloma neurophilia]